MLLYIRKTLGIATANGDPRIKVNRKPSSSNAVAAQQAKSNSVIGLPQPISPQETNELILFESYDKERETFLNSIQHGELLQNNQEMRCELESIVQSKINALNVKSEPAPLSPLQTTKTMLVQTPHQPIQSITTRSTKGTSYRSNEENHSVVPNKTDDNNDHKIGKTNLTQNIKSPHIVNASSKQDVRVIDRRCKSQTFKRNL